MKDNKQLLDSVFVICRIINVEVRVMCTETLIIWHITKTESNNSFIPDSKLKIINMARKTIKNNAVIQLSASR